MLPEYFNIIASGIASLGGLYYLYCTIRGTVKPNRVTWFFWGAFPIIAFAAQFSQGVGLISWVTLAAGLPPLLVVVASYWNPEAYWEIKKSDYVFAAIAILSIILWQITDNANLALTFALLADLAAGLPTVVKSYKYPGTESWIAYGLSALGFVIALLTVDEWLYENVAFAIYLLVMNTLLTILALRRVG